MPQRLLCNPCRGRGSRIFITFFVSLQCFFIAAVFVLLTREDKENKAVNNMCTTPTKKDIKGSEAFPTKKSSTNHSYVNFKFVYPEIQPRMETSKDFYLVILINSAAKGNVYRQRRAKIRQTWASKKTCEHLKAMNNDTLKDFRWILVFVLGKTGGEDDQLNIQEARQHNDMIIGDISDNYLNNILKFYMGQIWASFLGTKYTLKTDDDVYLRIPKVIEYLVSKGSPSRFYGGVTYHQTKVARWAGGKWSISKKYFQEDEFPPFNAGAFILFSTDLVGELMNYVHFRKPFHTDDAYIGVAMRDLKIKVVHILSFVIENNMSAFVHTKDNCYILKVLAYGHRVGPGAMEHVHKRIEDLCLKHSTLETVKCPT